MGSPRDNRNRLMLAVGYTLSAGKLGALTAADNSNPLVSLFLAEACVQKNSPDCRGFSC